MKAVVAAFNQEKALVGAFSVITNLRMELFEALVTNVVPYKVIIAQGYGAVSNGCSRCEHFEKQIASMRRELEELRRREEATLQVSLLQCYSVLELVPLQMDRYYAISALQLALRRLPALCTTLGLELVGGLIIDDLNVVITNYPLIVSFMPTISALSGNLGLQASSNTVRGLGTGEATLTLAAI